MSCTRLPVMLGVSAAAFALGLLAFAWSIGVGSSEAQDDTMHNCPQADKWAISVWSGQDATESGQALDTCGSGAVAAAYYLDPSTQAWLRWFDGRPEVSNLQTLSDMQGVIALGAGQAPATPTPMPTATPTPTHPPTSGGPELGTYSGTTSQGRPIQFDVLLEDGSRVVNAFGIDIEGTFPGGTCEVGGVSIVVTPAPAIGNNTFSYTGFNFDISGTFDTTTTASGDLDHHSPSGFQTPGCDSGPLTWTASLQ